MKYVPYMELRDRSSERAICGAETIAVALPDDFAVPQNHDAVRVADGGKAVRDGHQGPAAIEFEAAGHTSTAHPCGGRLSSVSGFQGDSFCVSISTWVPGFASGM